MAARARRSQARAEYWPSFVDVLTNLLLVFIFLLSIFALVQFVLSREISGRDTVLQRLNQQISELTRMLALERASKSGLADNLVSLQASLAAAEDERDRLRGLLSAETDAATSAGTRISSLADELDTERQISERALAQVELLNQQISALRRQIAALEDALEVSEQRDRESQTQIADLGRRLNVALAQRVQELNRFRSDFFGRLRQILGDRPDIRIVGDRFVFQSEVFFGTGSDELTPEGRTDRTGRRDPAGNQLGAARRRPHRQAPDQQSDRTVSFQLGPVGLARHFGGAVPGRRGRTAEPPARRRLWRVPADRGRRQ